MKMEVKIEGCPYEDSDAIEIFAHAFDIHSTLSEVKQAVRSRLKWGENLTEEEIKFLESLQDIMLIESVNL